MMLTRPRKAHKDKRSDGIVDPPLDGCFCGGCKGRRIEIGVLEGLLAESRLPELYPERGR